MIDVKFPIKVKDLAKVVDQANLNPSTMNDNKLIAEFMGYKLLDDLYYLLPINLPQFTHSDHGEWCGQHEESFSERYWEIGFDGLMYNSSWEWLMPVVDKIESIHGVFRRGSMTKGGQLHNATEKKYVIEYGMHDKVIAHVYANSRIDAEYQAVVEFIKEYNLKS